MLMNVFRTSSPQGLRFSVRSLLGWLSASSMPDLEAKHAELFTKITKILGREPTEREFVDGIAKPEPTAEQVTEARQAKVRADRAKRLADEAAHNPEAIRLRVARERAEEERVAGLTPIQRELELAEAASKAAEQRRADKVRKQEIRESAAYRTIRQGLNDAILVARLDSSITQEQLDALERESTSLEASMDIPTIRANLATIQKAIAGEIELRDAQLREAVDRSELRRRMLAAGSVFDSVDTEIIGDMAFVVLSANGQTKKVSQQTFDSRESDEALKASLFGEGATNV